MAESRVSAYIKSKDAATIATCRDFVASITESIDEKKHKNRIVEISGLCFDNDVTDRIGEFASGQSATANDRDLLRFAWSDEYGTEVFWVITADGVERYQQDENHDAKTIVEAYEAVNKGLGAVRAGILSKQELGALKKEVKGPGTKLMIRLVIEPPTSFDPSTGEPPPGYFKADASSIMGKVRYAYWMPIANDKSKTAEALLEHLQQHGAQTITAVVTPNQQAFPYRLIRADANGIRTLLDIENYTDDELDFVNDNIDDEIGRFNWISPEPEDMHELLERLDPGPYLDQRLGEFRGAAQQEREELERLWAEHPGRQNPLVQDLKIEVNYENCEQAAIDELVLQMKIVGMRMGAISEGLPFDWGPNAVVANDQYLPAAEWLAANIEALKDFKVVKDPWLADGVVVNTQ